METSLTEEQRKRNELAVQIADILNEFPDISELKSKLTELKSVSKQTVDVLADIPIKMMSKQEWEKEISKALETGVFSEQCHRSSLNWGTCAVGARIQIENPTLAREIASKGGFGSEVLKSKKIFLTNKAADLGASFWGAVIEDKPKQAKKIFDKIQSLPYIFSDEEREALWGYNHKYTDRELKLLNDIRSESIGGGLR